MLPLKEVLPPFDCTFEGLPAKIYGNYDRYLSSLYGDYMQLPPPEKRERHFIMQLDFGDGGGSMPEAENQESKIEYPKFTATIACYAKDNPEHFESAFLSIYYQTLRPDEIIITVDGPIPPELDEVVQRFGRDFHALVLRTVRNKGQAMSHALAVAHAKYDWVAIMDADDIALPDRFEKQLAYIAEHPDVAVIGGQIEEFLDSPYNIIDKREVPVDDLMIKKYLKKRCPFNHMTIIMNRPKVREAWNYLGRYNEDYFLYCRLFLQGAVFHNLPDTLVYARVGNGMYSRRCGWGYFKTLARHQKWMLKYKIISFPLFCFNVLVRLFVHALMPNWLRGFVYQKLLRRHAAKHDAVQMDGEEVDKHLTSYFDKILHIDA